MSVSRRKILGMGSSALGAAALGAVFAGAAAAAPQPRAETQVPDRFQKLPPGSVVARGWLAGQLHLQLDGLCGTYENVSHFLDFTTTGWVHPEHNAWEEVPYWLRGYIPLAIATGDAHALTRSREWVDGILATQGSDGFFGPRALRTALNGGPDFWPFLPLLQALRTHEEYTHDQRVVPFLVRFLRYMNAQGPGAFNTSWVSYRWGDGLDIVVWLHRRTGEAFLLDLAAKMHTYGVDWTGATPSRHNVNIAQGFREPAQYAQLTGSADLTRATYRAYDAVMDTYGRFPGGGLAGDENFRPGFTDPRQGFETCGIVEFMASHELLTRITGDPVWADRCEDLAFNMLPASSIPTARPFTTSPAPTASTSTTVPRHKGSSRTASPCRPSRPASTSTGAAPTTTAWAGRTSPRNSGSPVPTAVWPPPSTLRAGSEPRSRAERRSPSPKRRAIPSRTRSPSPSPRPIPCASRCSCECRAGAKGRGYRSTALQQRPRTARPGRGWSAPGATATSSVCNCLSRPSCVPGPASTVQSASTGVRWPTL